MELYKHIPAFSIMLPLVLAAFLLPIRKKSVARTLVLAMDALICVFSVYLFLTLNALGQSFTYSMGHFPAPWGNELKAGALESIVASVLSFVIFACILGVDKKDEEKRGNNKSKMYYIIVGLLMSSIMALVYTNDMFTGYVFIEINTIVACAIAVADEKKSTVLAAVKYLVMSVVGSGLFLLSVSILYSITGHLLMEPMHSAIDLLVASGRYHMPLVMTFALFLISIAIKSALFPFHGWLPDAHASAASSDAALLAGVVLKGYIILLIKIIYRVYGLANIAKIGILPIVSYFGLVCMIVASVLAIRQKDLKRLLAFSSIAQIGYIYVGIGMGTVFGLAAACFHIIAHSVGKSMLLMSAGVFKNEVGSPLIQRMSGVIAKHKVVGLAFFLGALSMIGIPVLPGFASKFFLALSSMQSKEHVILSMIVLALSTFLNAAYYLPALVTLLSSKKAEQGESGTQYHLSSGMSVSFVCLILVNMLIGICCVQIYTAIQNGLSL